LKTSKESKRERKEEKKKKMKVSKIRNIVEFSFGPVFFSLAIAMRICTFYPKWETSISSCILYLLQKGDRIFNKSDKSHVNA